jgi:hypothetical protein
LGKSLFEVVTMTLLHQDGKGEARQGTTTGGLLLQSDSSIKEEESKCKVTGEPLGSQLLNLTVDTIWRVV